MKKYFTMLVLSMMPVSLWAIDNIALNTQTINFGHIPMGVTFLQKFSLCSGDSSFTLMNFESSSGLSVVDELSEKLSDQYFFPINHCKNFILINNTQLSYDSDWRLKANLNNGQIINWSVEGHAVSETIWSELYGIENRAFIYSGSLELTYPNESKPLIYDTPVMNMVFDRKNNLIVTHSGGIQGSLTCIKNDQIGIGSMRSEGRANWEIFHQCKTIEGICGLTSEQDGDRIATTSQISHQLTVYNGCGRCVPIAIEQDATSLDHSCNVAFLPVKDKLEETRLLTLGRRKGSSYSDRSITWLGLWSLGTRMHLEFLSAQQVSHSTTMDFISSMDAIGVPHSVPANPVLVTHQKMDSSYLGRFLLDYSSYDPDNQLTHLGPPGDHVQEARKTLHFDSTDQYLVSVSASEDKIIIEACNKEMECQTHQIITGLDSESDESFTPVYAAFAHHNNNLIISTRENRVYLLKKSSKDQQWHLTQTIGHTEWLPEIHEINKAIYSQDDQTLAVLSAKKNRILFYQRADCRVLKNIYTWPEKKPSWWRLFEEGNRCYF